MSVPSVLDGAGHAAASPADPADPATLLAHRVAGLSTAAPFAVPVEVPGRRYVHLTSGGPAPEALPVDDLAVAFDALLRRVSRGLAALQYSDSAGVPRLRTALAHREGVSPSRVVVTNGALHGVQLAMNAVLDPGDLVVVDDPVFPDTTRIVESAGGVPVPVAVGENGIDVDAIESLLRSGRRIKAVYTVADFHNPSGVTLSAAARLRLVELAERYGFLIVSDNPYRVQRFAGDEVADLPAGSDRVVRINTFSKTLGPGLRLGWVVAPEWLAPHLVNLRRRVDFHSATLTQHVVADLLERPGWFDGLIQAGRAVYAARSAALVSSLRAHTSNLLRFTEPDGGFFVWAEVVADGVTAPALAAAALEDGVVFPTGSPFAATPTSPAHRFVRLAYSAADPDDLTGVGPVLSAAAGRARSAASRGSAR